MEDGRPYHSAEQNPQFPYNFPPPDQFTYDLRSDTSSNAHLPSPEQFSGFDFTQLNQFNSQNFSYAAHPEGQRFSGNVQQGDVLSDKEIAEFNQWIQTLRNSEKTQFRSVSGQQPQANSAFHSSLDHRFSSASGRDFYSTAYYNWLSSRSSDRGDQQYYNPFGSDDVFVHQSTSSSLPRTIRNKENYNTLVDDKVVGSKVTKSTRPTFAEVAKNQTKSSNVQNISPAQHNSESFCSSSAAKSEGENNDAKSLKPKSHSFVGSGDYSFHYFTTTKPQDDACSTGSSAYGDSDARTFKKTLSDDNTQTGQKNIDPNLKVGGDVKSNFGDRDSAKAKKSQGKGSNNTTFKQTMKSSDLFDSEAAWKNSPSHGAVSAASKTEDYHLNDKQKHTTDKKCHIDSIPKENTLNNNSAASKEKKASVKSSGANYIVNDLGNSSHQLSDPVLNRNIRGKSKPKKTQSSVKSGKSEAASGKLKTENKNQPKGPTQAEVALEYASEVLKVVWEWTNWALYQGGVICLSFLKLLLMVIALLCALLAYYGMQLWKECQIKLKDLYQYLAKRWNLSKDEAPASKDGPTSPKTGLKENISLPSTGQEAMKRLLSCKGKDPYSILGVRSDTGDDEIKKYYRRQAMLVHPDKNKEPGAEEAFKILGHAIDLIGTEEKRKQYDSMMQMQDAETAMEEFADLLSKLGEKIREASNLLRCDKCGSQHKRIPVDRPIYAARFCRACDTYHQAKEGDIWAESRVLGFLWHYYACMEGKVFDITEWVSCKRDDFSSMQANSHQIFYKLSNTGHRGGRRNEAQLQDFIKNLLNQHIRTSPDAADPMNPQQQQAKQNSNSSNKGKRKKRR